MLRDVCARLATFGAMNARMLLADFAQVAEGKLIIVGGGWTQRTTEPAPSAIAGVIEVDWSSHTREHHIIFELLDEDGFPVIAPDGTPLRIEVQLVVDSTDSEVPGADTVIPLALNLSPLPLEAGHSYEWRLALDGQAVEGGRLPFRVVAAPDSESAAGSLN
jgi:hypothetical protein